MLTSPPGSVQYDWRADAFYFDRNLGAKELRAGIRQDAFVMLIDYKVRLVHGEHLFL